MKDFENYLENLPFTKTIRDRITHIVDLNKKIYNEEIIDIVVCDYKNHDNSPVYSSLWLFTNKAFLECKNFLNYYDFDITPISDKIDYCSIDFIDFDLENANDNSKVNIHIRFNNHISGEIVTTGVNCNHALNIYRKHVIANLK